MMMLSLFVTLAAFALFALLVILAEPTAALFAADAIERAADWLATELRARAAGRDASRRAYRRCYRAAKRSEERLGCTGV